MKNKILLFTLIIFSLIQLNAQERGKYDLLLLSGTVRVNPNTDRLSEQHASNDEIIDNKYFRIIQFQQIPTDKEKEELKTKGIDLIGYLPNFSFFAAISQSS